MKTALLSSKVMWLVFLFMFVGITMPVRALDLRRNDHGGRVEDYVARIDQTRSIRIGPVICNSSCTLYLAKSECISPRAVFGFHAPWRGYPSGGVVDEPTVEMFAQSYRPGLRELFLHHVNRTRNIVPGPMMKLTGSQLARYGYRLC